MCEFCGKKFLRQNGLQKHVQTAHPNDAGGPIVGIHRFQFMNLINFFQPFFLSSQKKPSERVNCHMCDATFVDKYRLKTHIETIHLGKPVKCTQCDKISPNESALVIFF